MHVLSFVDRGCFCCRFVRASVSGTKGLNVFYSLSLLLDTSTYRHTCFPPTKSSIKGKRKKQTTNERSPPFRRMASRIAPKVVNEAAKAAGITGGEALVAFTLGYSASQQTAAKAVLDGCTLTYVSFTWLNGCHRLRLNHW